MDVETPSQAIGAFLSAVERGDPWRDVLQGSLEHLPPEGRMAVIRSLDANRLTCLASDCLAAIHDPSLQGIARQIEGKARRVRQALRDREAVLGAATEAFGSAGISYAVFKTLNGFQAPGVDVDAIVRPEDFGPAVAALEARGFRLIDDPGKRYATGLALDGNPIIVDLHTDLAVLGIRYASPDLLLEGARDDTVPSAIAPEGIRVRVAPPQGDALVRMAHAVIKEGVVTLLDVAEVLRLAPRVSDRVREAARGEGLDVAVASFARIAGRAVPSPLLASFDAWPEEGFVSLAQGGLARTRPKGGFPATLPVVVSLAALAHRLRATEGLGRAILGLRALRFQRNVEQLRSKVVGRLGGR